MKKFHGELVNPILVDWPGTFVPGTDVNGKLVDWSGTFVPGTDVNGKLVDWSGIFVPGTDVNGKLVDPDTNGWFDVGRVGGYVTPLYIKQIFLLF